MIPDIGYLYKTIKEQSKQLRDLENEITGLKIIIVKLQTQIKRLQNP